MKPLFQITTMLGALSIAGLAVAHFPISQGYNDTQAHFARAPQVAISPLTGAVRDRLGNGWIVSN
ncbi:hypothetical protein RXV86_04245 [Alisedimentitalea sp. MJ-SS2]|uniref:hypothetical protein n=1 Tax=Aliisedimentitalea sp. MJ-SS2 TaxID=3049795 RepID=UPI00291374A5|nr:hypothetical protein [Alisedimentitalea sp. MJ-SS2]MDU8926588.1 hypothetical protein [Alisedimentitalea sp. MJ-SS2]